MGRGKNRRRSRPEQHAEVGDSEALRRAIFGGSRREEVKRGARYTVTELDESRALKEYVCPGCGLTIAPGVAHVVVWRADGIFGEDRDLAERRHWHQHCWRIA